MIYFTVMRIFTLLFSSLFFFFFFFFNDTATTEIYTLSLHDALPIYNPLPNGLHGPWNLAAVQAGKHVLSEKPFASNAEEAVEVRDAAEAAGVVVLEGFHYLFHPVTQRLHELLESGELGE